MAIHKRLKHFSIVHAEDAMFCFKKRKLEWNNVLKGCREKKNLNDWFNTTLRNAFALHAIRAWTLKKKYSLQKSFENVEDTRYVFPQSISMAFSPFFFFDQRYFIWSRTLALTNIKSIFWPCDEVCVFNESFARFLHSRTLQSIII